MNRKSGIMLSEIAFPNMPVLLKHTGIDFLILDCEHGYFDYNDIARIIMNANLVDLETIIRIPDNNRKDITKLMDMGARGLLLPMTNTACDIRKVVEYAKYTPIGKRGLSTMRAHSFYNPKQILDYMKKANEKTKIFAQIETIKGLNNVDDILKVEGVDGFMLGPNDLSSDMNCLGKHAADEIINAIKLLKNKADKNHKISGIITNNHIYIEKAKKVGMNYFSVGSELSMLKQASINTVKLIQE